MRSKQQGLAKLGTTGVPKYSIQTKNYTFSQSVAINTWRCVIHKEMLIWQNYNALNQSCEQEYKFDRNALEPWFTLFSYNSYRLHTLFEPISLCIQQCCWQTAGLRLGNELSNQIACRSKTRFITCFVVG